MPTTSDQPERPYALHLSAQELVLLRVAVWTLGASGVLSREGTSDAMDLHRRLVALRIRGTDPVPARPPEMKGDGYGQ